LTLEALIKEAANSGRFVGLSIWQTAEGRWQASICVNRTTCSIALDGDPVAALVKVLGGAEPPSAEGLFD